MTISASDQQAITQGLEKAKEDNSSRLVSDGVFLALCGGAAAIAAASGAAPFWLMLTQVMLTWKGLDTFSDVLKRQSLAETAREMSEDPAAAKARDKIRRLKSFSAKCLIGGGAICWASVLAPFSPLLAPLAAPLFLPGLAVMLTGVFAMDIGKGAEAAVKAVDEVLSPAPPAAPAAPAAAPASAAPSKVASLSAGPSFTAAANDDKSAAPAPKAEPVKRPFRTFDF